MIVSEGCAEGLAEFGKLFLLDLSEADLVGIKVFDQLIRSSANDRLDIHSHRVAAL